MSVVDLRSDTITLPTPAMLEAMVSAPLGDMVLGDDPTVIELERRFAEHLGKPAACYVPSGTMGNQVCIKAHTEPGDEIIADGTCHISHYEAAGPAANAGCQIRFADGPRGIFGAADVRGLARPEADYLPRTRLVLIENTCNKGGGSVWPMERVREVGAAARELGVGVHIDGARLWNASVASGVSMAEYAREADTVTCCFSKGLGAPVGSCVAGSEALVKRARRFRSVFGGCMRQAGVLAGAALYAMDNHIDRLADDHANARALAEGVNDVGPLSVDLGGVETNIVNVLIDPAWGTAPTLVERLAERSVSLFDLTPDSVRAVTHLGVDRAGIDRAIEAFKDAVATPA